MYTVVVEYTKEEFSDLQDSLQKLQQLTISRINELQSNLNDLNNTLGNLLESEEKLRHLIITNQKAEGLVNNEYENRVKPS